MPDWLVELLRYGPLGLFAGAVVWGFWKVVVFCGHRLFDADTGLVTKWVAGELAWRTELTIQLTKQTERLEKQTEACVTHVDAVRLMGDSLTQQIAAAEMAHKAAVMAQESVKAVSEQMAAGNKSLKQIDETLTARGEMLRRTSDDVSQLKGCVFHLCDMCQAFVAREFPGSVGDVSGYLLAIKKKVNDDGGGKGS